MSYRYQAKPKDTAQKLFIDLMNHYRFRVDLDADYGFIQKLRGSSVCNWCRFSTARNVLHDNITYGVIYSGWSLTIHNPIFENVIIPNSLPDLIETGEQLATMIMVAGIPYKTEIPNSWSQGDDEGIFITYLQKLGHGEKKAVLMPLQWTTAFILAALGVADEMMRNQAIHTAKITHFMR